MALCVVQIHTRIQDDRAVECHRANVTPLYTKISPSMTQQHNTNRGGFLCLHRRNASSHRRKQGKPTSTSWQHLHSPANQLRSGVKRYQFARSSYYIIIANEKQVEVML